jgi:hypothetical protein
MAPIPVLRNQQEMKMKKLSTFLYARKYEYDNMFAVDQFVIQIMTALLIAIPVVMLLVKKLG